MSCFDARLLLLLGLASGPLGAAEHLIGLGIEADTEDSKAFSLMASFALGEDTWINGSVGRTRSPGDPFAIKTTHTQLGIDHHFDPIGIRVGGGYWGDSELLDAVDLYGAVYFRNERFSLSFDYEHRDLDLTFRSLLLDRPRFIEFEADGVGASARLSLTDTVSVYANGMSYDYSQNIALEPRIDVLRIFAVSRLSMMHSLLDERVSGGIEFEIGDKVLDFRASNWRTAVFGDEVSSFGAGLLLPAGSASDIEFRIESDSSDTAGSATLFSVFLYFYGD